MKIMLDAGHSPSGIPDPGASGNGLVEAILTGQLVDITEQKLSSYDVEVLKTSRGTLSERAREANNAKVDFFASIHINASPGGQGYESHVHPNASEATLAIAESIHTTLASWYSERGHFDRGLKRSNFAVLRETNMPAVLLENLFIDNPGDAAFLRDNLPGIGNEIAWAIVQALKLKARPVDPCVNCQKVNKLFAENQKMKNMLSNISLSAAEYVTK